MIKVIPTKYLAPCPICGSAVQLQRNSGKRFQIKCTNPACYVRTAWMSKTSTLCSWSDITARIAKDERDTKALEDNMQSAESIYRDRKQRVVKE